MLYHRRERRNGPVAGIPYEFAYYRDAVAVEDSPGKSFGWLQRRDQRHLGASCKSHFLRLSLNRHPPNRSVLMTSAIRLPVFAAVVLTALSLTAPTQAQQATMSFFVTSVGKGNGADLGGLAGADAHCQALSKAAGSTETNWHAYLSTTEPGGVAGINARDRIGKGPWQNAKGIVVAKTVEDLHSDSNNINKQTALTEQGEIVSGRGDAVNMHDILTGSDPQGVATPPAGTGRKAATDRPLWATMTVPASKIRDT
jgi:hypothetical protein